MPVSPSTTFWVNTLTSLGIFLIASTLLLLVLAAGVRQRLNLSLTVLATSTAIVGLGLAVSSVSFWLNFRVLENGSRFGEPLFWIELAAAGFYFVGPALLTFAIAFAESSILAGNANRGIKSPRTRLSRLVIIIGYLVGLGLLPAIFSHRVLAELYMDRAEILRLKLTDLGYVASAGPILLQLLALLLFWQNRKRRGGRMLTLSISIWITGSIFVILATPPFPIASLTLGMSALITGYAVFKHRIFEPSLTSTQRLEAEVADRTAELRQVRDRLQHFHTQQHAVGQICCALSQMTTDPTSKLQQLPNLIHKHLGYQHVYLYEPDKANQSLVVRAAAGSTAETILESPHERRIGRGSLVGQVAAQRQPRVAETQGEDAVYFTGTALPGARAEMALPLLVGDRLLGVLDLQSIHLGAFSEEDLTIMTSLADQVSITLDHARRLQETQSALADLEKTHRRYWHHVPESSASGPEKASAYIYSDGGGVTETSPKAAWTPEMSQAATLGPVLSQDGDNEQASLSLPIVVRDQIIGAMQLRHKSGRKWQREEIDALGKVAERLGLALEARRLSLEAQQRSAHEHVVSKITDQMQRATDMETLMQITANELKQALGGSRVYVHLGTDSHVAPSDRGRADR
jgi:GAF domain-containing protein